MKILGAVLAGGQSRRFGSDKAMALLDGDTLLNHAIAGLRPHCAKVGVIGRRIESETDISLEDWPEPGKGPLGGLAGALLYARQQGFDAVLTSGVDLVALPPDLPAKLRPPPAFVADQPVIGLWPASALETVRAILMGTGSHAMRAFTDALGARPLILPAPLPNINWPADLDRLRRDRNA